MAREKQFEYKVRNYLKSIGVYPLGTPRDKMTVEPVGYFEKRWGGVMTSAGLPDMSICIHGRSIEVELKAETGRLSDVQKFMINQIKEAGGTAFVLFPCQFEWFKTELEKYL